MTRKPNVILINCDDMGYGDLGCYGSQNNSTPTIDKLAEEGMLLTSFYAASPVCSPSRAALLTGCYPPRVNINGILFPGEAVGLNPKEFTLGNLFKESGYATKIVGKWHVGDQQEFLPLQYGFDDYYGLPYSNDMGRQLNYTGQRKLPPLPLVSGNEVIEEQPDQCSLTARYTEQCKQFIRKHKEEPFFLYLAHMHMHLPHYCAEPFMKDSKNGDYGGCIKEGDWSLNSIIHEIKQHEIYDYTIIIFTSDNGSRADHGASNGVIRGTKFTTYEGGQRVPCIIYWKEKIKASTISNSIASQIDLLPTLANIIGADISHLDIDGVDLTKQLCSDEICRDTFVYMGSSNFRNNRPVICGVRKDNWKLHLKQFNKITRTYDIVEELYDLENDPSESINLFEEQPEVVRELSALIRNYIEMFGDEVLDVFGKQVRICGKVDNPKCMTEYNEDHPYIIAMYDKEERG